MTDTHYILELALSSSCSFLLTALSSDKSRAFFVFPNRFRNTAHLSLFKGVPFWVAACHSGAQIFFIELLVSGLNNPITKWKFNILLTFFFFFFSTYAGKEKYLSHYSCSHLTHCVPLQILLLAIILIALECNAFYRCCQSESCNKTYRVSLSFIFACLWHLFYMASCSCVSSTSSSSALVLLLFTEKDSESGWEVTERAALSCWCIFRMEKNLYRMKQDKIRRLECSN